MTVSGCPMLLGTGEGQAHSEAAALVLERYSKFDKAALTQSSTNLQPAHPNFLRQLVSSPSSVRPLRRAGFA